MSDFANSKAEMGIFSQKLRKMTSSELSVSVGSVEGLAERGPMHRKIPTRPLDVNQRYGS